MRLQLYGIPTLTIVNEDLLYLPAELRKRYKLTKNEKILAVTQMDDDGFFVRVIDKQQRETIANLPTLG
ncbi:hypothetical protein [Candidatus Borrarchaeum sp.]|uniref:hypothetical protein n=1 Tax=Candidatus Borrarchaeum sp. TaxID=2846742 RepID=UPI00257E7AB5|nr:hypothetical protein [Candidatus Borrarchaeum sp.]